MSRSPACLAGLNDARRAIAADSAGQANSVGPVLIAAIVHGPGPHNDRLDVCLYTSARAIREILIEYRDGQGDSRLVRIRTHYRYRDLSSYTWLIFRIEEVDWQQLPRESTVEGPWEPGVEFPVVSVPRFHKVYAAAAYLVDQHGRRGGWGPVFWSPRSDGQSPD